MEYGLLPNLSHSQVEFLDRQFQTNNDLSRAPELASQLKNECEETNRSLLHLYTKIADRIVKWASHSQDMRSLIHDLTLRMDTLHSSTDVSDETRPNQANRNEQILMEEMPSLAREVARVERVRIYAETTLQLEALVGDLEDAVSSAMAGNSKKFSSRKLLNSVGSEAVAGAQEKQLIAVKILKDIEDILVGVAKSRPHWSCLVAAVDERVDRAIATLRPLAIANHRALLTSLGWPPPLATTNLESDDQGRISRMSNPLLEMHGDIKEQYGESFLALSTLQAVQLRRKTRQLDQLKYDKDPLSIKLTELRYKLGLHEALWTIEELVAPIALRAEYHFSKWTEKPEFIFALGYRLTQEFIETVDNVLQPLLDKARLLGYSAREEWVSAMVSMILTYLTKQTFPALVTSLVEEKASLQVRSTWLHLIDLIIAFDKRMRALLIKSVMLKEDTEPMGVSQNILDLRISCMSVFCDRPDWLELWGGIELKDAREKLKIDLDAEKSWAVGAKPDLFSSFDRQLTSENSSGSFLFSTREDYKAPLGAESVLSTTWAVINRCRFVRDALLRLQFIRTAAAPILTEYLDMLLQRCQEAEALTALADDDAMVKVSICINSARYCESVIQEWCEDIFFLELQLAQESEGREENGGSIMVGVDSEKQVKNISGVHGSVFDEEIENFKKFQMDWLAKLMAVILRGFDARCREYIRNKKQWQDKVTSSLLQGNESAGEIATVGRTDIERTSSTDVSISVAFVDALDVLQSQLNKLKEFLNEVDFMDLWRGLAGGLDLFLFNNIPLSNAKFSDHGVCQFKADVHALFQVFKPFCVRPAGFFPNLSDSLKVLTMPSADVKFVQKILSAPSSSDKDETKLKCLKQLGIRQISVEAAVPSVDVEECREFLRVLVLDVQSADHRGNLFRLDAENEEYLIDAGHGLSFPMCK